MPRKAWIDLVRRGGGGLDIFKKLLTGGIHAADFSEEVFFQRGTHILLLLLVT